MDSTAFILYILLSIQWISEHISNYIHSFTNISLKNSHHVGSVLPRCIGIQITSHTLDLQLQLQSTAIMRTLEMQML